ncbi:MAG: hypothetical protein QOF16_1388 [Actinomycetota bacterium]|nr:hypothetical protein [Actinomycetota bacterium]MEA2487734.1 hypothetical protein [Actinomycetota bacterium]
MIYLLLLAAIAGVAIARLWIMQRRERSHLETVDGFQKSLERLSSSPGLSGRPRSVQPRVRRGPSHRPTLDPERRAAAKRRLEARRRSMKVRQQQRRAV